MITPDDTQPGEYVYALAKQFGFRDYYRQQYILVGWENGTPIVKPTPADCARRRQATKKGVTLREAPEDSRYRYDASTLYRSEHNA